jgi:hypothetical protein
MEYRNKIGQLHREDGPAIIRDDGYKSWWINGKLHRTDGPAIEWPNGTKCWYQNDCLHRDNGFAVEYLGGHGEFFKYGHRAENSY